MMVLFNIAYVANIAVIMGFIFYLTFLVADKKYNLFFSVLFYICSCGKLKKGLSWYHKNPLYFFHIMQIYIMLMVNLTLMGQLMKNDLLTRPWISMVLSIIAWSLVFVTKYLEYRFPKRLA